MKVCLRCKGSFSTDSWQCPQCGWKPVLYSGYPCFASGLAFESNGFDPEAHEKLSRFEQRCFWFRSRNQLIQFVLETFFPSAQSLFEIGCGTGFVLAALAECFPGMRLVGGDIYVSTFKNASSRVPKAEFIQVDATALPYKNEFDVIGAFDVLEHLDDDERAIKQMQQAVKSKGGIIVTVPQHPWLWSPLDEMACHKRRYSRRELISKIESAGLQVKWVTSFMSMLLPFMAVSRIRFRLTRGKQVFADATAEFQLPKWLDFILEKVCDVETRFIEKDLRSFPMGGSLLAVAMKE
jgi:SAM-dependent methyltransferase